MNGWDEMQPHPPSAVRDPWHRYQEATTPSPDDLRSSESVLRELSRESLEPELMARVQNDLGVLAVLRGDTEPALTSFRQAIALQPEWSVPRQNLELCLGRLATTDGGTARSARATRIAIVSLLFNWPSTGGGTVHTAELARFLSRAGYEVRHFVVRYAPWEVGQVTQGVDWPIEFLDFNTDSWSRSSVQGRVREAITLFSPDHVIITDSWSFKPRFAEALAEYSCFLRLAAQECLCPLTNIRLLRGSDGGWYNCPRHQLASREACRSCVEERSALSGSLHQQERALAGFRETDYETCLRRAFADATGVLVVNPLIAECVKPHSRAVHVLPSGFDAGRFRHRSSPPRHSDGRLRIVFAGIVEEPMKGFAVLQAACRQLWQHRQNFRLVVTADSIEPRDDFIEAVGWQSQAELPELLAACDIVVCPTIAEEALGRTAVEAMGAGRPVVASRIGGLPFVVLEEATGLLARPGDVDDWARQIGRLLDDPPLRERLGAAGRKRFEESYTWEAILPAYASLLGHTVHH